MNTRLILLLVMVGVAVVFIIQNAAVVEVNLLFWSVAMSRALLIFFALAIGLVVGWFLHSLFVHRKRKDDPSAPL